MENMDEIMSVLPRENDHGKNKQEDQKTSLITVSAQRRNQRQNRLALQKILTVDRLLHNQPENGGEILITNQLR